MEKKEKASPNGHGDHSAYRKKIPSCDKSAHRGGFNHFARVCAKAAGNPLSFGVALGLILGWAITGPIFHFSDTWQLVINTGTTIITFLMVFLIQNTQNRYSEAVQLKLDELIRAAESTHNALLDIEELSDDELAKLKKRFAKLARVAREEVRSGKSDLGTPDPD